MQGNLYDPLGDLVFDRIVAHPPYVPVLKPGSIYCDGGEDGEQVTRGVVQGLPRFLEPNGRFYCLTMGVEREGEPFEQRVRQWLGEEQSAFDLLFIVNKTIGRAQFAFRKAEKTPDGWAEMDKWKAHLERLKIRNLVYGILVLQRKEGERRTFTVRREKGSRSGGAEVEWLRRWETASANPASLHLLLQSRPLASPDFELHVTHAIRDGKLTPSKFTLRTDYPFGMESECEPWAATLVARCDGKTTAVEHFEAGKRENWIRPGMPIEEFASILSVLVSEGVLEVEGFRLPRQTDDRSR